jgi:hypothetical protein
VQYDGHDLAAICKPRCHAEPPGGHRVSADYGPDRIAAGASWWSLWSANLLRPTRAAIPRVGVIPPATRKPRCTPDTPVIHPELGTTCALPAPDTGGVDEASGSPTRVAEATPRLRHVGVTLSPAARSLTSTAGPATVYHSQQAP